MIVKLVKIKEGHSDWLLDEYNAREGRYFDVLRIEYRKSHGENIISRYVVLSNGRELKLFPEEVKIYV